MPPTSRPCQPLGIFFRCDFSVSAIVRSTAAVSAKRGARIDMGGGAAGCLTIARRVVPHRFRGWYSRAMGTFIAFISGDGAGQSHGTLALQWNCIGGTSPAPSYNAWPPCPLPSCADAVATFGHLCAQPARCNWRCSHSRFATRWTVARLINSSAVYPSIDFGQWRPTSHIARAARCGVHALVGLSISACAYLCTICYCRWTFHKHCGMTSEKLV